MNLAVEQLVEAKALYEEFDIKLAEVLETESRQDTLKADRNGRGPRCSVPRGVSETHCLAGNCWRSQRILLVSRFLRSRLGCRVVTQRISIACSRIGRLLPQSKRC